MARLARVVATGAPHHVTQRGNRRQTTFFSNGDYAHYRDLLPEDGRAAGVEVWAYGLKPNHGSGSPPVGRPPALRGRTPGVEKFV